MNPVKSWHQGPAPVWGHDDRQAFQTYFGAQKLLLFGARGFGCHRNAPNQGFILSFSWDDL
jgi:hypothetical protein